MDKEINEVTALTELRALALRRVQLRQRKDDREMKSAMRSPEVLMALVGDELIEELILEDPDIWPGRWGKGSSWTLTRDYWQEWRHGNEA